MKWDLKLIYASTRPWPFRITYATLAFAAAYALYSTGTFEPIQLLLLGMTFVGVLVLHIMVNWLNDYFDYYIGTDTRTSGSVIYRVHPIYNGVFKPHELLMVSLFLGVIAVAVGLAVALLFNRPLVLLFGFIGLFLALFYNAPPFGLKYRALGEVATFLGFFFMFIGAFYVMTGFVTWEAVVLAVIPGLLTASVLASNNVRDIEEDSRAGFATLAALLGRRNFALVVMIMVAMSYLSVVAMVALGKLPLVALLSFITFPAAVKIIRDIYSEHVALKSEKEAEDAPVRVSLMEVRFMTVITIALLAAYLIDLPFGIA
ncbi:MAG: prenyltransferase [Acidilobaceae archaeon]|nr:prenyltransferase [Acidilobaceae archaeon]MDW7974656.1 prenyltransferase [Sulfolobales archaeon]